MSKQSFKYSSGNHGYCNAIMQVAVVACLGLEEPSGRSAEKITEKSPEKIPSRRGLNKGRGKMVIFKVLQHSENGTIGTGSMN